MHTASSEHAGGEHDQAAEGKGVMDFIDDDENVKAMRETARAIGLVDVLVRANRSRNSGQTKDLVRQALRLLGASEEEVAKP